MKAARVHRFGPPEVITLEEMSVPSPGEDEIVVRVAACGVGPWDAWVRAGKSAIEQPLPLTLGADLSAQLAKARGARVVGTGTPRSMDYVRSLGVEQVVDATAPDFTRDIAPVHAVIDTVGGATQRKLLACLAPGGILVSSVSHPDPALTAPLGVRGVFILVQVTRQALVELGALAAIGRLTPRLGPTLPLSKARLAHEMLEGIAPRPVGKMVLQPG
jgi:NADPH:quinone reductase-like Zn-dependent oxidoreductase